MTQTLSADRLRTGIFLHLVYRSPRWSGLLSFSNP